jgi:hypothetical protein
MEVINATPNPLMATEILLGTYEQPEIPETTVYKDTLRTVKSVDYWLDQVKYTYEVAETKGFYIHEDTDKDQVTIENYEEFMIDRTQNNAIWISIPTGKISISSSYCSIDSWLNK